MAENAATLQEITDRKVKQAIPQEGNIPDDQVLQLLTTVEKSLNAWDRVGAYTNAKLKAVEHSQDPDNPLAEMTTETLERKLDQLGYTRAAPSVKHH